jgi:hypothetical protein
MSDAVVAPVVSPVPWQLTAVMFTGVFSATIWGLATLFRPRPRFAAAEPEPDEEDPDEAASEDAPRER